jgi:hypothetical protein
MINFYRDIAEDTYKRGKTTFKIHDLNGNEFSVMMTMNSTVYDLKQEIHYKYNKSIVEMNLYYNEHKLRNDKILQDCNFLEQDNIILKQKPVTFRFYYC